MGACYSCQSRSGKHTYMYYASDMSLSSRSTLKSNRYSDPQMNKPVNNRARMRNSNENLVNDNDRSGPSPKLSPQNKSKSQPSLASNDGKRFGFRPGPKTKIKSDSNSNITVTGIASSTDSLDSYGPDRVKAAQQQYSSDIQQHLQRPNCMTFGAFAPRQMARWRMIDDSDTGTLTSMSLSPSTPSEAFLKLLTSDSQKALDTNGNSMAENKANMNEVQPKQSKIHNERKPYSRIPNVGSRLPTTQRHSVGSTSTTTNTSSSSGEKADGQSQNKSVKSSQIATKSSDRKPRRFVGGWFGKKNNNNNMGGKSSQLSKQEKTEKQKNGSGETAKLLPKTVENDNGNVIEVSQEGLADVDPSDNVFITVDNKKQLEKDQDFVIETEIISGPIHKGEDKVTDKQTESASKSPDASSSQVEDQVRAHVPLAKADSLDSTSICSLNSDDLMLDLDLGDDPADQSSASLDRSLMRGKSDKNPGKRRSLERSKRWSREDDFTEESEQDVNNPAVDKAVHAAVASQIRAAVPCSPSTPSVPSSPDVQVDAETRQLKEKIAGNPDKQSSQNVPAKKPTSLDLGINSSKEEPQRVAIPRRDESTRGMRPRVSSASEAVSELSNLTSQLNESHPIQR